MINTLHHISVDVVRLYMYAACSTSICDETAAVHSNGDRRIY